MDVHGRSSRRRLAPGPIVSATHNPGKVTELAALLEPLGFEVTSAQALGLAEPEETETTFRGNAELKARAAARAAGLPALADDSGLAVEALGGAPGVYSARWAGPGKDFALAMRRVRDELAALDRPGAPATRAARFVCALAVAWPDGHVETFEGEIAGELVWPPRGARGFGYDPAFVAAGRTETFGEMEPAEKHAISHRARALAQLRPVLREFV